MSHSLIQKFSSILLCLLVIGVLLFCAPFLLKTANDMTSTMPSSHGAYDVYGFDSLHGKEFTVSTIVKSLLDELDLLLVIVLISLAGSFDFDPFSKRTISGYFRQTFCTIRYCIQKIANHWLALFELSPSFA